MIQTRQSYDLYYLSIQPQKGVDFCDNTLGCPWLHERYISAVLGDETLKAICASLFSLRYRTRTGASSPPQRND